MTVCTICGIPCYGMTDEENAVCEDCYQNNLSGNQLAAGSYIVYEAMTGPPLLLEAVRLEARESIALGQWMDAHMPASPFLPYEPRHVTYPTAKAGGL